MYIIIFVDHNSMCNILATVNMTGHELQRKFVAFQWNVLEVTIFIRLNKE